MVRRVVKAAKKRVPVIAGAGSNSTAEAIALAKDAREAGADAMLQITPYYNRPTQEGLYLHFRAIAEAVPLPIVLYNVPARTGCDLLPETIARLAELPSVVGGQGGARHGAAHAADPAADGRSAGHPLGRRRHQLSALRRRRARLHLGGVERGAAARRRRLGRARGRRRGARAQAALRRAAAGRGALLRGEPDPGEDGARPDRAHRRPSCGCRITRCPRRRRRSCAPSCCELGLLSDERERKRARRRPRRRPARWGA